MSEATLLPRTYSNFVGKFTYKENLRTHDLTFETQFHYGCEFEFQFNFNLWALTMFVKLVSKILKLLHD